LKPTSSIDLAPTLLGLAGFKEADLLCKVAEIQGITNVKPLAGADLSGREVIVLVDAVLSHGLNKYILNGNLLAPGIYFTGLSYGNQHLTRKMIVIR
jgi:hypothetical protein